MLLNRRDALLTLVAVPLAARRRGRRAAGVARDRAHRVRVGRSLHPGGRRGPDAGAPQGVVLARGRQSRNPEGHARAVSYHRRLQAGRWRPRDSDLLVRWRRGPRRSRDAPRVVLRARDQRALHRDAAGERIAAAASVSTARDRQPACDFRRRDRQGARERRASLGAWRGVGRCASVLWALGGDVLRAYTVGPAGGPTRLDRTFEIALPNEGGHDLVAIPGSSRLFLSTVRRASSSIASGGNFRRMTRSAIPRYQELQRPSREPAASSTSRPRVRTGGPSTCIFSIRTGRCGCPASICTRRAGPDPGATAGAGFETARSSSRPRRSCRAALRTSAASADVSLGPASAVIDEEHAVVRRPPECDRILRGDTGGFGPSLIPTRRAVAFSRSCHALRRAARGRASVSCSRDSRCVERPSTRPPGAEAFARARHVAARRSGVW